MEIYLVAAILRYGVSHLEQIFGLDINSLTFHFFIGFF